jgi:hypothetical protein
LGAVARFTWQLGFPYAPLVGSTLPASEPCAPNLSDAWATIFHDGSSHLAVEALPRTQGIAVYAGWDRAVEQNVARSGWTEPIERVVVGSPIFVEQIAATARP